MKFNKKVIEYLNGNQFDNGLYIDISKEEKTILSRHEKILNLVKGKSVIHLGCCDHIPLIKEKIDNDLWLHKKITDVSKECIGVDINSEGIDFLKSELGYDNVICNDITSDDIEKLSKQKWDYIIIGEILEHVNNPVQFLNDIVKKYGHLISNFLITVPNAFSMTNFKGVKKGQEIINTDHRYWFSPFTLAKVGYEAGLEIEEFFFVFDTVNTKVGLKAKLLLIPYLIRRSRIRKLLKFPAFREGILAIFKPF